MQKSITSLIHLERGKFARKGDNYLRKTLILELLQKTEDTVIILRGAIQSYRNSLKHLVETDKKYRKVLKKELIDEAFAAYPPMLDMARNFATKLRQRYRDTPYLTVHDIVNEFFCDHKLHQAYITQAEHANTVRSMVNMLLKEHEFLRDFDQKRQQQIVKKVSVIRPLDLVSILWYPRVALLEYMNLIFYLESRTPKNHQDKGKLLKACTEIELLLKGTKPTADELNAIEVIKKLTY